MHLCCLCLLLIVASSTSALNVVIAGGTGKMGRHLSSSLVTDDSNDSKTKVTILTRNAFLAASPARVTHNFGWLGASFMEAHPRVSLRDWDGGDMLDIVGCDWVDWADDTLPNADVVVNLVGGYTTQRVMATERILRESLRLNPKALQVTVSPRDEEVGFVSPGAVTVKRDRIRQCEDMVEKNCLNYECLRVEANNIPDACAEIRKVIVANVKAASV